jgi:single-stranded-DNA-specific exonuclease
MVFMKLISLKNNKILLKEEISTIDDLFEYLWKKKYKNIDFMQHDITTYLENINNQIPQFEEAIKLATKMILDGNTIGIIGDYDVDGTIATSILVKFFNHINNFIQFNYIYHIPNRFTEGYGPSIFAVEQFQIKEVNLIITVDSGSTAYNEIHLANTFNIKSIILDHHMIQENVPEATCFVNNQNSENFKYLCGSGLAFVFAIQLQKALRQIIIFPAFDFKTIIDLVAIATVCDFVPLINLNRDIVHYGLKLLNYKFFNKPNKITPAIHIILQYSMYNYNKNTYISATDLGFSIGPYLNVAGRLKDANMIVEFLVCEDPQKLELYFFELQNLWLERKKIQKEILDNIIIDESEKFILLADRKIHEGIMGIIASQIKEKFYKPTIIIALNDKEGKGSIRSISPFDAGKLIELALEKNILIKGGGHAMAGGFSIYTHNLEIFKNFIQNYMTTIFVESQKEIIIDSVLSLQGLNKDFFDKIQHIGPFGVNNEEFVFFFPFLVIKNLFIINTQHISFTMTNITKTIYIKTIWFFVPIQAIEQLSINDIVHIVAYIKYINDKINLYIIDIIKNK